MKISTLQPNNNTILQQNNFVINHLIAIANVEQLQKENDLMTWNLDISQDAVDHAFCSPPYLLPLREFHQWSHNKNYNYAVVKL